MVFEHWEEPAFKEYVSDWRPSFLLGSEAANEIELDEEQLEDEDSLRFLGRLPLGLLLAATFVLTPTKNGFVFYF